MAAAQEPLSIETIAAGYLGAETYCEAGKWRTREHPETTFSRCAHSDGRFKFVMHHGPEHTDVLWSDSRKYYRHAEAANHYQESPLDDVFLLTWPANRSETYPIYLSRLFNGYSPDGLPRTSSRYFQSYKASSALSTPQHSVFERFDDGNRTNSERLWVRNADKAIVRYEGLRDGVIVAFAEISSQEANRPLTDADLSHHVPLYQRFSLKNNPVMFMVGLFAAAGFGGALFWGRLFSRAASFDDVVLRRRRLWRVQFWAVGVVTIALAVLAAVAVVSPGHGGLVIIFVLALWCAVAFALAAWFTLMSYPVQVLYARGARGAERPLR